MTHTPRPQKVFSSVGICSRSPLCPDRRPVWLFGCIASACLLLSLLCGFSAAQDGVSTPQPIEKSTAQPDRTLYVVGTAHLDTQWLWTIQTTIDEFIPNTLRHNFERLEKYPDYVFSFEGAFRYMLAKEYYPDEYSKLKEYVRQGRWAVCGSWVDAVDVNVPSPESLIRHVLYGNGYFQREFGKTSCDIFLPDCFGFGYALPSVAAHCGLKGFSTQKLTWGSSVGIPFERIKLADTEGKEHDVPLGLGVWEGVNGQSIIASLNPGDYVGKIREDLSLNGEWRDRIDALGRASGAYVGYKYFGVGDQGGAPDDDSVGWLEKSIAGDGPIRVKSTPADQLYRDLTPEQIASLPRYKGELLMTRHGVGCYTSQAVMKRWNRKCEQLADAAERAAAIADWLGGATYPREKLNEAWIRFLWHQFHDDLTGTSIPEAYPFSWNDQLIAMNQFAEVLRNSVGAIARRLNTNVEGTPLIVFNPLSVAREDIVEAAVKFERSSPSAISVHDIAGNPVAYQLLGGDADTLNIVFLAKTPPLGAAVYEVRAAARTNLPSIPDAAQAGPNSLENGRYRVIVNDDGDIASIYDKAAERELLRSPVQLQMLRDAPTYWPEWEINYDDISAKPFTCVSGPASISVTESGPVRAALEVARTTNGSTIVQTIRLAAGDAGDRVEVEIRVDWRSPRTLLKAAFPLTVANEKATYDLGLGTVQRGNNRAELYEVPAQQWADITNANGDYGVSILNDCSYGWDKPADDTLRLTLIHSPDSIEKEMGYHRFCFAIMGHKGTWQDGKAPWHAARLNQPLAPFQVARHDGEGATFSLAAIDNPQIAIKAMKKAEDGEAIIVRVQELQGDGAQAVRFDACGPIAEVHEVNGAELRVEASEIRIEGNGFRFDMAPYEVRTFAIRLREPASYLTPPASTPLKLAFDIDAVSLDSDRSDGDFDGQGHTLPGELLPKTLIAEGIPFTLGPDAPGEMNAMSCRGQEIPLPQGDFDRLYLLAATAGDAILAPFAIDGRHVGVKILPFTGYLGQSNCFITDGKRVPIWRQSPPFMPHEPVAWVGTHRHSADGRNEPYVFTYLHKCVIDLSPNAKAITLPNEPSLRVFAMTAANNPNEAAVAACDLFDNIVAPIIEPQEELTTHSIFVRMKVDNPEAVIRFTVDGSEPTIDSAMYERPFRIDQSVTINACAFVDGKPNAYVARRAYRVVTPQAPVEVAETAAGLDYRCFKSSWPKLPSLENIEPNEVGVTDRFAVSPQSVEPTFAVEYKGYIRVPRKGVYTFKTRSNKGSRLYIAGDLVVDNTSWRFIPMERFGSIALAAGLHEIKVEYLQPKDGPEFSVDYAGPGFEMQPMPNDILFRAQTAVLSSADAE